MIRCGARIQEAVVSSRWRVIRIFSCAIRWPAEWCRRLSGDYGAGRRRGGVLAGDYGLHIDDGEDQLHVRDRAGCDRKDGDNEDVTKAALGGAATHNEISGVAHFMAHDDAECVAMVRELLSFLPSNNLGGCSLAPIARRSGGGQIFRSTRLCRPRAISHTGDGWGCCRHHW